MKKIRYNITLILTGFLLACGSQAQKSSQVTPAVTDFNSGTPVFTEFNTDNSKCVTNENIQAFVSKITKFILVNNLPFTFSKELQDLRYCKSTKLFSCLSLKDAIIFNINANNKGYSTVLSKLDPLIQNIQSCGGTTLDYKISNFFIASEKIIEFYPTIVHGILIFAGEYNSFDTAVSTSDSIARVLPANCNLVDGCVRSPVSFSACEGCEKLQKQKTYTIFFQTSLKANDKYMQPVIYKYN